MVYVVGSNHGIQQDEIGDTQENTEERTEQRAHFTQLIEEIVSKEKVDLICEEWDHDGGITIARGIAGKCGTRWFNINTGAEDLRQMGIPPIYTKLTALQPGRKAQWHAEREKFMLRKIQEKRGCAENLLVICGFDHMLPLSELLREGIADVEVVDYRKLDWYRPGVFFGDCSCRGN